MKFAIVDASGWVIGEISNTGVTIDENGGTPAAQILGSMRFFRDPQRMAESLLRRWVTGGIGYDGGWPAAVENRLYVSCDDSAGYASAIAIAPR